MERTFSNLSNIIPKGSFNMRKWTISEKGRAISWDFSDCHHEDIEMAGLKAALLVGYGKLESGILNLDVHPVFPTLRLRPNDTHASYQTDIVYGSESIPALTVDGETVLESPVKITIDGTVKIDTVCGKVNATHHLFPSNFGRAVYDILTVTNISDSDVILDTDKKGVILHDEVQGPMGVILCEVSSSLTDATTLPAGESFCYANTFTGRYANEERDAKDAKVELEGRMRRIAELREPLELDTGCDVLDTEYAFAKLRAGESVFDTKCCLIHSPGGCSYYAAIWCNDEVEYAGPWYSLTGDKILLDAGLNAYRLLMPFMGPGYSPIPVSVIAEGVDIWDAAGDRGDAAMYLYGASYFALTCGDRKTAEFLLPAIRWCAEYCRRKTNDKGVIESDKDELEGRFPAGDANLSTASLALQGYRWAAKLEDELGDKTLAEDYRRRADSLVEAIERHFGANIHGFETYRYFEGCEVLRSWICLPLCVGIDTRAEETVKALLSDYMLTPDGLRTSEERDTIWDRSTLYCLRGIFATGLVEEATAQLLKYSETRLLGDRVPYPVEAYPEGGKRHLSGESALYCKIFTDGILKLDPESMSSFSLEPTLPTGLDHFYLRRIRAFGHEFDVLLDGDGYRVEEYGKVIGKAPYGEKLTVQF